MKKIALFAVWGIMLFSLTAHAQKGYEIKVQVAGLRDSVSQLAFYFGNNTYLKDTAVVDKAGNFMFKGTEPLPGGIYLVTVPGKGYFEFIVDKEQKIAFKTDTSDLIGKMVVTGSEQNRQYFEYQKFLQPRGKGMETLKTELDAVRADSTVKEKKRKEREEEIIAKIKALDKEVKDFRENYIKQHPGDFLSSIFKALRELEVPEPPILENGRKDSTFQYHYYKNHYWDNIDFTDERIVRTPLYHIKLKEYMETLTLQVPDSVNKSADIVIEKTRAAQKGLDKDGNPQNDLFKFTVFWITYNYETSKLMGADAVFVHLAEKYYAKDECWWLDSARTAKVIDKAAKLKPILIGKTAPSLNLIDTAGASHNLLRLQADYVVVFFWDPNCGHCRKETPQLKEVHDKLSKKTNIKVYAVSTVTKEDDWKTFIREKELGKFINVWDPYNMSGFRDLYDISSTPKMFLLDKEKKIIAKQISVEQLEEIIEHRLEQEKNKK